MRSVSLDRRGGVIAAIVVVVLLLALYLGGRWQERSRAAGTHGGLRSEIAAITTERDRIGAELAAARDENALLRARALLFETALDLERRNFGTANSRLDQVAEHLASLNEPVDPPRIDSLRAQISRMDLRVASDLAGQRATVLGFAARLDTLITAGGARGDSVGSQR